MSKPIVGIIMGSDSDLEVMSEAAKMLEEFAVPHEVRVVSAHRTPDLMAGYANSAKSRGLKVIIAGAGGSAHLPGMTASYTSIPVIAVPVKKDGHDHEALWSSIKMPPGIPLATMPENGAVNAALLAVEIISLNNTALSKKYDAYRLNQQNNVIKSDERLKSLGWKKFRQD